jgi:hypothetical protein
MIDTASSSSSSMMCSSSGERFEFAFDFSGIASPTTWIDFCLSLNVGGADVSFSGALLSSSRHGGSETSKIVCKSFEENIVESLEV